MVADTPVTVTVLPDPAPFAIVTVVPLGAKLVDAALTDTIVPAPLLTSGLAVGKEVWLAIATKPPTSSIRSTTRKSIAAVVATNESEEFQVAPLAIVSEEFCLRKFASHSVSVKYLLSS